MNQLDKKIDGFLTHKCPCRNHGWKTFTTLFEDAPNLRFGWFCRCNKELTFTAGGVRKHIAKSKWSLLIECVDGRGLMTKVFDGTMSMEEAMSKLGVIHANLMKMKGKTVRI